MAMEIDFGPALEQFRHDMRGWIEQHREPALLGLDAHKLWVGHHRDDAEVTAAYERWEAASLAAHLLCPLWPREYGGGGLTELELSIFETELSRAGMPRVIRYMSEYLVGPTVIAHGTPEQKAYFLPRIIDGTDRYCQGFSEPGHGSDLAGVQMRGVVAGDEILLSGQKLWTSDATACNMIFVLCRTNPDAAKHRGLSFVLTPLLDNNITLRPLRQMSGRSGFCEEFFDEARAPLFNVIGGVDNGWAVAMTLLSSERGGLAASLHLSFQAELDDLVDELRARGRLHEPLVRERLGWMYTHVQLMRFGGMRILGGMLEPGQPGPHPSVSKLFWSEYHRRFGELALSLFGPEALVRPAGDGYPTTRWQDLFLSTRAETILSGTSEIQRRIIGDRVLGLPRDA